MGMCNDEFPWRVEALKEVTGTGNWITVEKLGDSIGSNTMCQRTTISLSDLCRNNKDAQIKFACRNKTNGNIFSSCNTSVNVLTS